MALHPPRSEPTLAKSMTFRSYHLLPLLIASLGCATLQADNTFHVSSTGKDANPGSEDAPLATLKAARDAIRNVRQNDMAKRKQDFTVIVHPGSYRLTETLELGPKEYDTTWKASQAGTVIITGGPEFSAKSATPLTDSEKSRILTTGAADKILRIDLRQAGIDIDLGEIRQRGFASPYRPVQSELFIDGKPLHLARWPNQGAASVPIGKVLDSGSIPRKQDYSNRGGTFHYGPDRVSQWTDASDAWIYGYFAHGYSDDSVKIAKIDPAKKTIQTAQPSRYGFMSGKPWRSFFAFNLFEEIDQPGEYFIDRKSKVLYFYPPADFDPATSRLSLSALSTPMVAIEDTRNVKLQGFTFENTRGIGVYMEDTQRCIVDQCTLRNIGLVAVVIGNGVEATEGSFNEFHPSILTRRASKRVLGSINERIYADTGFQRRGGSGNAITNSHIHHIGCGGLHIGGGDFKTLERSKNRVENCHIHHVNRLEKSYRAAVNLDGVGQIVKNNLIEHTLQSAIYFHGNDHLIEYNKFNRCLTYGDDMGVIYYGRNPTELGTTVRYNLFQDCARGHTSSTPVIYADDGANNITVHGNLFLRSGTGMTFLLGGGSHHHVYENAFVQSATAVRIGNRLQSWSKSLLNRGGVFEKRLKVIPGRVLEKRYPFMAGYMRNNPARPQHNTFSKNLLINSGGAGGNAHYMAFTDNYQGQANPVFVNPQNKGWSIALPSEAKKILGNDFTPPPLDSMGLQKSQWGRGRSLPPHPGFEPPLDLSKIKLLDGLRVNFQTDAMATPEGWKKDSGRAFGPHGDEHYGWSRDMTATGRVRKKHGNPVLDSLVHFAPGAVWELAVKNGRYRVQVSLGDAEFACPHVGLKAEGVALIEHGTHNAGQFLLLEKVVDVRDGRLTLSSHKRPNPVDATRINFVCVKPLP